MSFIFPIHILRVDQLQKNFGCRTARRLDGEAAPARSRHDQRVEFRESHYEPGDHRVQLTGESAILAAGTPSTGPRGQMGGGNVTGIGSPQRGLESYCSSGRFQWQFVQPVYVGSNQMQKGPPGGASSSVRRDIAFYEKQIGEISADGKMPDYNYALSQIAHEMGHRWSAFVSAKVGDERIALGPTHWARGLQAPVAFPFQRPFEASIMEVAFGRTISMGPTRNWTMITMFRPRVDRTWISI
jgi:hypothetical protein